MNRLLVLLTLVACAGCAPVPSVRPITPAAAPAKPKPPGALPDGIYAEINTARGRLLCELYFEKTPLTVANFVGLAEGKLGPEPRRPYFDGLAFHRVVPEFVIQGGDPTGSGRGGPGYKFPDEFAAGLKHDGPGVLSMANSGPDTNGSQFFITLGEARYLDYVHSIFGRVIRGAELLPQIQRGDTFSVRIIREGAAAENFRADQPAFEQLLARASRAIPPHFIDRTTTGAGEHWQSKYIEYRLANLARFTGRQIFVRLLERFEPETPAETIETVAPQFVARLNLPPGALAAVYFAAEDRWILAGAPAGVALPTLTPPPAGPSATPNSARQKQNDLYKAVGQVVSSLIDQTDPR